MLIKPIRATLTDVKHSTRSQYPQRHIDLFLKHYHRSLSEGKKIRHGELIDICREEDKHSRDPFNYPKGQNITNNWIRNGHAKAKPELQELIDKIKNERAPSKSRVKKRPAVQIDEVESLPHIPIATTVGDDERDLPAITPSPTTERTDLMDKDHEDTQTYIIPDTQPERMNNEPQATSNDKATCERAMQTNDKVAARSSGKSPPQFTFDLCAYVTLFAQTVARLRKNLEKKKFRVSTSHKGKTERACVCAEIPQTSVR